MILQEAAAPPKEAAPLTSSRGGSSTESQKEDPKPKNLKSGEQFLSAGAGAYLALHGVRRGGLSGVAMLGFGAMLLNRGITGHCGVYEKLGIDKTGSNPPEPSEFHERGVHVAKSFTIDKPAAELFKFWRNFENLPTFMTHLKEVKVIDEKRSHWIAKAPAGAAVEWDAEVINEEPDKSISWRSLAGADVHSTGSVQFIDAGERGTEVRVAMEYLPPLGKLGVYIAKIFGEEPSQQVKEDLRHFKQLMEAGEIPTNEGPRGSCRRNAHGGER